MFWPFEDCDLWGDSLVFLLLFFSNLNEKNIWRKEMKEF